MSGRIARPKGWNTTKMIAAFAVIYVVWGSTFLAIRVGVERVDPLLLAAARFLLSGAIVLAWATARKEQQPSLIEWRNAFVPATLMFLIGYGCLFWAEKYIPSGLAALVLATIPIWFAVLETFVFRMRQRSASLWIGTILGVAGVVVLVAPTRRGGLSLASVSFPTATLIAGSFAWALGTFLMKRMSLPKSRIMNSGVHMLVGGLLLLIATLIGGSKLGDLRATLDIRTMAALAYLVLAGSVLAFSTYVWLLDRVSPTKVSTYAFANPVVAVALGVAFAGERLSKNELVGGVIVLAALATILVAPATVPNCSK
jgi:drug/metabolite transporter (DMT)-like permease